MKTISLGFGVILSAALLQGCTGYEAVSNNATQTGAAVGAVTGAIVGYNTKGHHKGERAAIGAVLGATAGALAGNAIDGSDVAQNENAGWQ